MLISSRSSNDKNTSSKHESSFSSTWKKLASYTRQTTKLRSYNTYITSTSISIATSLVWWSAHGLLKPIKELNSIAYSSLLASSLHGWAALGGAVYQLVFVHHPIGLYALRGLACVEDESSLHAHSPASAGHRLFSSDRCPMPARRDPIRGGCMAEEVPLAIASLQGFTWRHMCIYIWSQLSN